MSDHAARARELMRVLSQAGPDTEGFRRDLIELTEQCAKLGAEVVDAPIDEALAWERERVDVEIETLCKRLRVLAARHREKETAYDRGLATGVELAVRALEETFALEDEEHTENDNANRNAASAAPRNGSPAASP